MTNLTAIILAGGKGHRMEPYKGPKCLMPLSGVPILHRLLDHLVEERIKQFVIETGYKAKEITESVSGWKPKSQIVAPIMDESGESATMCERVISARRYASGPFLICYADELADVSISGLTEKHERNHALATITVYAVPFHFGIVRWALGGPVASVDEKTAMPVNIGYTLIEEAALSTCDPSLDWAAFLNRLARDTGRVWPYIHDGKRVTVNSFAELEAAELVWR